MARRGRGHDLLTGDDYHFSQQIVVSHDGQNFLNWESRSWVIDDDGNFVGPDLRETGFWRIGDDDTIELLLAHAEGSIELFYGNPLNQTSWNWPPTSSSRPSPARTAGAKRLYGLVPDGDLAYVEERIDTDGDLTPPVGQTPPPRRLIADLNGEQTAPVPLHEEAWPTDGRGTEAG